MSELVDQFSGVVIVLMPLFILSVPGFVLAGAFLLPLVAVALAVALAAAGLAAPVLAVRAVVSR